MFRLGTEKIQSSRRQWIWAVGDAALQSFSSDFQPFEAKSFHRSSPECSTAVVTIVSSLCIHKPQPAMIFFLLLPSKHFVSMQSFLQIILIINFLKWSRWSSGKFELKNRIKLYDKTNSFIAIYLRNAEMHFKFCPFEGRKADSGMHQACPTRRDCIVMHLHVCELNGSWRNATRRSYRCC